jgi:hypothetical protein
MQDGMCGEDVLNAALTIDREFGMEDYLGMPRPRVKKLSVQK